MLDWLNHAKAPDAPPPETAGDSKEVRGSPVFPVSRFHETASRIPSGPETRMDKGFPVSRFSRFQNEGGPNESSPACEEKASGIPQPLPDLLDAIAGFLTPQEVEDLRRQSRTEPGKVAELCRLILAAQPFPTPVEVAELDALIIRLCEIEPWLAGYLPEMQEARRRMAPANVADSLAHFRHWVREAEGNAGRPTGAGRGQPSR